MARRKLSKEEAKKKEEEFAQAMNIPEAEKEAVPEAKEIVEAVPEENTESKVEHQWISFKAYLSSADALALKEFFNSRNIEFKAI